MKICFIVEGYPTERDPFFSFIKETVVQIAKKGHKCIVIAPQSITRAVRHKHPVRPTKWIDEITDSCTIEVYQPIYFTIPGKYENDNSKRFYKAAKRAYEKMKVKFDCLYAHFWHMGVVAEKISSGIPIFVACGESKISVLNNYSYHDIEKLQSRLAGVVYVSTKSYQESVSLKLQNEKIQYIIAPNGFNPDIFSKIPREKARKSLGYPEDAFIISFVGAFVERKGVKRLSEAIDRLQREHGDIYSIFIGSGREMPECKNILFQGKIAHDNIPTYLCASNVFVLPTKNEGCCNAIVEAIGCGIPIISSNQTFNDDILNDQNSLRVDSQDVDEITDAISQLYCDRDLLRKLENGSIKKAKTLTINMRADKIISFMLERIENNQ